MAMKSKRNIYLVSTKADLTGSKLPSKGEVLSNFLHYHQEKNLTIRPSAAAVVDGVMEFWAKARIPTIRKDHSIAKVEKLYTEYQQLKKGKYRRSTPQIKKEEAFKHTLKDVFDVAADDALSTMSIQEDKDFLLAQREPGRRGIMGPVDISLTKKERRASKRKKLQEERKLRSEQAASASFQDLQMDSSSTGSSSGQEVSSEDDEVGVGATADVEATPGPSKRRRATKNILTPSLAAVLDRSKVTDRKATLILAEAAQSFGQNLDELNINRSSIRRQRQLQRKQMTSFLKTEFTAEVPLTVHWDGKLMKDLTTQAHVDRLPILVSGSGVSQLLQVAKIPNGTGKEQAKAVVDALEEWGLVEKVVGMAFDTTASNTGRINGACTLIEQKLGKNLLYFACRHHMLELVAGAAYTTLMAPTKGPEELLFKRFQARWESINQNMFETGADHEEVALVIQDTKAEMTSWAEKALEELHDLRDDYRELLELSLIFLGGTPSRGVHFIRPGPMHHARWMSKAIYSLKVWMFRGQFKLTQREEQGLRRMSIFVVTVYVKYWIEAPLPMSAPRNDLELLKTLHTYKSIDKAVSKATLEKFSAHQWYLSEELVALSFFDPVVPSTTKDLMAKALREKLGMEDPPKRVTIAAEAIQEHDLEDFVTKGTQAFFKKMSLPIGYLCEPPDSWNSREDFQKAYNIVQGIKVTNDNAERGVALIQEYNRLLTHDEDQLQYLLQIVAGHRQRFPDSRKSTLLGHK